MEIHDSENIAWRHGDQGAFVAFSPCRTQNQVEDSTAHVEFTPHKLIP